MEKPKKREVPSLVKSILSFDANVSNVLVKSVERLLPSKQLKLHNNVLEVSCHGIVWIGFWLAFIWILNNKDLYQMQVNFLIGLLLDVIFVAVLKALFRRRRPRDTTDPFAVGPDKYSFPSGHASRVTFIIYFFLYLWPVHFIFMPPLFAWLVAVCVSRLLMRRHHVLDIASGVVLGIFEGLILGFIYLERDTCIQLIYWITDEKMEGPEYDV